MSIIVGSARIDEKGNAHGGSAGDQSGKEVSTQTYYNHKKGWVVLRAKKADQANKIAKDMLYACANHHIGYDQYQRDSLFNAVKDLGYNCSKVTKNVETDCSALVRVCCCYAGIIVGNFRTYNERKMLLATGQFDDVTSKVNTSTGKGLCIGDILVTKTHGHTVVVVKGATSRSDVVAKEDVKTIQKALNSDYKSGLEVDGKLGPLTKKALEKVNIEAQDNNHPNVVKFIQGKVGVTQDGKYGPKTKEAVEKYQKDRGLKVDGITGPKTLTKMLS